MKNPHIKSRLHQRLKSILPCVVFLTFSYNTFPQDLTMLSGNPQWWYASSHNGMMSSIAPVALIDDDYAGFLEINGMVYHKMFQIEQLDTDNGETLYAPIRPLGVREENGKVYVLYDDFQEQVGDYLCRFELFEVPIPYQQASESELLLYDFTLQIGDRYPSSSAYANIYVENVEMLTTEDGNPRKLLTLTNGLQILEGVGCLNCRNVLYYLYPPTAWKHWSSYQHWLIDYKKDGETIYKEQTLPSGIRSIVQLDKYTVSGIYDLEGRKLPAKPRAGQVYIKDGRKQVRK